MWKKYIVKYYFQENYCGGILGSCDVDLLSGVGFAEAAFPGCGNSGMGARRPAASVSTERTRSGPRWTMR